MIFQVKEMAMFLAFMRLKERLYFAITEIFISKKKNSEIYYDEDLQRYREEQHIWY